MEDGDRDPGIGRRVRAARGRLGCTREELAIASGLSWAAIAQIESGRRASPRPATLSALAKALGVSIDYLVDGGSVTSPMLVHAALLYDSDEAFADATAGFVREGLQRSEPVLAVTTKRNAGLLRDRLGGGSERLQLEDSRRWLQTPEGALASFQEFVAARLADGAAWTRIIGEPLWVGRSAAEVRLWTRFESLVNVAFAATPLTFLCPYDERALDPAVIEQARSTHPRVIAAGEMAESATYRDPVGFAIEP